MPTSSAASALPIGRPPMLSSSQWAGLALAIAGLLLPQVITFGDLSPAGHRMLGIFIMAIVLWISEAVPMHATATLIILLEVLLLSDKAVVALPAGFKGIEYKGLFATLADPVIILFLGGFFLADGASKFALDRNLSAVILRPFGSRPRTVLLGIMLITAVFSMFMSNTATTATMMTVAIPLMAQFAEKDRMRAAIALSIPVAANIGGIGTPIGTPPNAIALGALSSAKVANLPSFMQWTIGATPFMLLFLLLAWLILVWMFPTRQKTVAMSLQSSFDRSRGAWVFYGTFIVTVVLWMTESLHGLNSNVVGFVPVVVLLCTRVFTVKDLQNLDWHVLWLVAGGIALGVGIGATGMDKWFIGLFPWGKMSAAVLIAVLAGASLLVGTFISHSATANLLVPIGISLARSGTVAIDPVAAGVFIAIGSSLAMALPISTPPNAIAFATGEVKTRDMAIVGALVGGIGWAVFVTIGPWVWRLLGILPPA